MVGLFGKGGMLSRDCRPGVCIFAGHSKREESKLLIHLPVEARKHQKNWLGRAIDAAETDRKSRTMKRAEGLTWL